jgi:hypothetical protein
VLSFSVVLAALSAVVGLLAWSNSSCPYNIGLFGGLPRAARLVVALRELLLNLLKRQQVEIIFNQYLSEPSPKVYLDG